MAEAREEHKRENWDEKKKDDRGANGPSPASEGSGGEGRNKRENGMEKEDEPATRTGHRPDAERMAAAREEQKQKTVWKKEDDRDARPSPAAEGMAAARGGTEGENGEGKKK
jgi:hypothetical protein